MTDKRDEYHIRCARAVVLTEDGEVSVAEREISPPSANQVLIRVTAAGCNRADLLQRAGKYPAPPGTPKDIPGLEFSGVVVETGNGVLNLNEGDRVMGITGGAAQAEYLLLPEELCVPVPESIDLVDAAAIPEAFFTAFEALVVQGGLRHGSRVLVNAVGSGVGTALVQIANIMGATVVGTSRTSEKIDRCRHFGLKAGVVVNGTEEPEEISARLKEEAGGEFDIAIDLLGGAHLPVILGALRSEGTVVSLGFITSPESTINLTKLVARRHRIIGTSLRSRANYEKAVLAARFTNEVLPLFESNHLHPIIDKVFPLSEAEKAYDILASNTTFGKVLLTMECHA